jgi:hypothetical protein
MRLVAFTVFAEKVGRSLDETRTELAKLPRGRPAILDGRPKLYQSPALLTRLVMQAAIR